MTVLQGWLIVGVPALIGIAAMFAGRSQRRAWIGYLLLAATALFFIFVVEDIYSGAAFSVAAFILVAGGRGTYVDREAPEHHMNRKRFTTDPSRP